MCYQTYLASRDYARRTVERTEKQPGDLVLSGGNVERVPDVETVVQMRKRAR